MAIEFYPYASSIKDKKVTIKWLRDNYLDYVDFIIKKAKNNRILIILNSVKRSQKLYNDIMQKVSMDEKNKIEVGLIHSRFIEKRRTNVEKEWVEKYGKFQNKGSYILIGTQVLEQSLNIDGDILFTDLCPIDMFLQRIGRLWRFDRKRKEIKPVVYTFFTKKYKSKEEWLANKEENGFGGVYPFVYDDYTILKTYQILKNKKTVNLISENRNLISDVYDNSITSHSFMDDFLKNKNEDDKRKQDKAQLSLSKICYEEDSESIVDDEKNDQTEHYATTRYIKIPIKKVVLANNLVKIDEENFKVNFIDGSELLITKEIVEKEGEEYIQMISELVNNSVSVPLNYFNDKDIVNKFKESYKNTILENVFGKYLFLLLLDENRNFLNIDGKRLSCMYIYSTELGLYKK